MADNEAAQLLPAIGELLRFGAIELFAVALLWGIHAVVTGGALAVLYQRGLKAKPSAFLFIILIIVLGLNTFDTMNGIARYIVAVDLSLIDHPDLSIAERFNRYLENAEADQSRIVDTYISGNPGLMIVVGDVVIVWRLWKIWVGRKLPLAIPVFLLLAAFAITLSTNTLGLTTRDPTVSVVDNTSVFALTGFTAMACSLTVNAFSTVMIGIQAYQHHKRIKSTEGMKISNRSWRIMFFLVEAGLAYLIVQLVNIVLNISAIKPYSNLVYVTGIWIRVNIFTSIMYLPVVVILVATNRSLANDTEITGPTEDIGTHISFAHGPPVNTQHSSNYLGSTHEGGTHAATGRTGENVPIRCRTSCDEPESFREKKETV